MALLEFQTCTPEQVSVPSNAIMSFLKELELQQMPMHGLLMMIDEKLFFEGYWAPYNHRTMHRLYSVSKSFVSLAIGFLADEGIISLSDRIIDHFPEKLSEGELHPFLVHTTISDMLRMASPHESTTYSRYLIDDWVKTFFLCEPSREPGTVFSYDTSSTHTLGALVQKVTGTNFLDYLRLKFLNNIGFSKDAYCLTDPMGIAWGGSGIVCYPMDLLKVAYCCMRSGSIGDEQIIPKWYIKEATKKQIDTFVGEKYPDAQQGYGYQFWIGRNKSFYMLGMGGQIALCLPDKNFVMVTTCDNQWVSNHSASIFDAFWRWIYPCLEEPPAQIQGRTDDWKILQRFTASLSLPVVIGKPLNIELLEKRNIEKYAFADNSLNITSAYFRFSKNGGVFFFEKPESKNEIHFSYGINTEQTFPNCGYRSVISAGWADDNTLNLLGYIIDVFLASVRISVSFKEDCITLRMEKVAEGFLADYSGTATGWKTS